MEQKLNKIRSQLIKEKLDALVVTDLLNVGYLSNFWSGEEGDALILVTLEDAFLFTDYRYQGTFEKLSTIIEPILCRTKLSCLKNKISSGIRRIGFEKKIRYDYLEEIKDVLSRYELIPTSNIIENLRLIKSKEEIENISRAAELTDMGFYYLKEIIKPGMTEKFVSQKLTTFLQEISGGNELSFESIIASGINGSSPHATVSNKEIKKGEFITLDFGAKYNKYCSDMTRTIFIGGKMPSKKLLKIYNIVRQAQEKALNFVKPEITPLELDKIARNFIIKSGYGKYFTHGTGHGVGISVHEKPAVGNYKQNIFTLKPGMIITIEPGIYVPKLGGVRIEDLVEVTKNGHRVLSESPKRLIEIK